MLLIPIKTPLLQSGDDLASILIRTGLIQKGDIIAISSKAIATAEGRMIDLQTIRPTAEAEEWSKRCGGSPVFCQAVLDETKRLHGTILPGCPQAMLTELKPDGLNEGTILVANAGLDESNVKEGFCIGWPEDAVESVRRLRQELMKGLGMKKIQRIQKIQRSDSFESFEFSESFESSPAIIITDSTCRPRRQGVTAQALVVSGFDPLRSLVGTRDLFGKNSG